MITLITGTPGSGKTLYAVSRIIKEINDNPDRPIYTDIKGLRIDGVHDAPDDWRDTPEGSLIVYDECQYRDMFKRERGRTRYDTILDMTTHRHTGRDIWLITQSPNFLHVDVLAVVGEHIHVDRPMGAKLANLYKWRQAETKPQGRTVKEKAENRSLFKYDKTLFNYYDSVDVDDDKANHKGFKLPWFLWVSFGGGALLLIYALSGLFGIYSDKTASADTPKVDKKSQYDAMLENGDIKPDNDVPIIDTVPKSSNNTKEQTELSKEQLEQLLKLQEQQFKNQLEEQRLQMMMQYDELQKRLVEHHEQMQSFYRTLELYKTMLPKDHKILKDNPDLQVRGVVKFGNKCKAYNKDGTLMTLTYEQCDYYTQQAGRVWKNGQTTANTQSVASIPTLTDKVTSKLAPHTPSTDTQNLQTSNAPDAVSTDEVAKP